jgi:glucose/mannose-6-phosphate isomerase
MSMDLDDLARFRELDPQDMIGDIDGLPDQLARAWGMAQGMPSPEAESVKQIVMAGVGGSAIGADLLAAYVAPLASVPVMVCRGYDLPSFAAGAETLLIASSHSGNTEETLSAFEQGFSRKVKLLAVTTGGELARMAEAEGIPLWIFEHEGQPRAGVGYSFGFLLAALSGLRVIPDQSEAIASTVAAMRHQQPSLQPETPVVDNPAKRLAGQLMQHWPVVIGTTLLAPVARRWRTQISEIAKSMAQFEELPEADHNMVAGVVEPEALISKAMVIFLQSSLDHPRNVLRVTATRELLMTEGFNTDVVEGRGDTRLAHQWTCLHFGDYVAFYMAMCYGIDPTPVVAIESLKARIAGL